MSKRNSHYSFLGTNCSLTRGTAITSNTKFIPPLSKVYDKTFTSMMVYPGQSNNIQSLNEEKLKQPEQLKKFDNISNQMHYSQNLGCSSCGS